MFDNLIDSFNPDKWETPESKPDGFVEYSVNRNHKKISDCCLGVMVSDDNGKALNLKLNDVLKGKDPLGQVAKCELILKGSEENQEIVAINIDDVDWVVRKDM